jgi:hypothetical protein
MLSQKPLPLVERQLAMKQAGYLNLNEVNPLP